MMYSQKKSAKRRMRTLALLPALGAAVLVANLPAVASAMSEVSSAQLFNQSAEPAASESKVTKSSANSATKETVYDVVEINPVFPGGEIALLNYLRDNLKYPEGQGDKQGRVVVRFVVTKTGEVGDVSIIRSLGKPFDDEAIRVVKSLPPFTPGMMKGKPVAVYYVLPINFKAETTANAAPKQTITSTININKGSKPQSSFSVSPKPENAIVKLNGEEVPYDKINDLQPSSIASMSIDKSGDKTIISITTK